MDGLADLNVSRSLALDDGRRRTRSASRCHGAILSQKMLCCFVVNVSNLVEIVASFFGLKTHHRMMGENESTGELEFAKSQQTIEWGGHPLFPRAENETGPDPRRFDLIHIQRYRSDGSRDVCPKAWRGADLRSWEQIVEAYGGGTYQLMAQCSRTFRFQAYSEKMQFSGPSKPFVAVNQSQITHEQAPVNMPQYAPAHNPPAYPQAPPHGYPYPQPPAASGNAETLALVRAVIESSNAEKSTLMRALLERPAKETGSLEVLREILPFMQGGTGGTKALLQGVELARGLFAGNQPVPVNGQVEDLAMLGQVLRMIAPTAPAPATTPAAPPSPPPAALTPPGAPPPGHTWAYTASGWMLVQLEQLQALPAQMPVPAPQQTAPKPSEPMTPTNSNSLEEVLADPEIGKLFAGLSGFKGLA